MNDERYVVLGLARPRAGWFSEITRWATSSSIPVEFVKCLTPDEARARLASGRRWSAFLVDGSAHGVDRDLLDAARAVGAAPLVIGDQRVRRDWSEIGAADVLPDPLERDTLLTALAEHARPVARTVPLPAPSTATSPAPWRGRLVAVTGPGGTGASTIAAMVAQGFGGDVRDHGLVVLADLALHADQAVLHDAGDIVPGLPELIDAHRLGRPEVDEIRSLAFHGGHIRGYDLVLGLRRHRDWTILRRRTVEAALDGLRRSYRVVVADVDHDTEGERETGSHDVEERNLLARAGIAAAEAVVVVGRPDVVGVHRLAALLRDLHRFGTPAERLLPVLNRAPRSRRARAELVESVARLAGADLDTMASAVCVPERRRLDEAIRAGDAWPTTTCSSLAGAVQALVDRDTPVEQPAAPERIVPGSLGTFTDSDAS